MSWDMKAGFRRWWQRLRKLRHLPGLLKSQAATVQELHRDVGRLATLLEGMRGELAERIYLLEQLVREPARERAESALRARLSSPGRQLAGVSILTPCWNHAGLLPRAVGSALATLDLLPVPGEVLILDDASRDDSAAVARHLAAADDRVRVLQAETNLGIARARKVLLDQARFPHGLWLDADNELIPDGVTTLYQAAVQTGAVMTYGSLLVQDEMGIVRGIYNHDRAGPDLFDANYLDTLTLVHIETVRTLGGYTLDCPGYEDWEFNLHLLRRGQLVAHVPVVVGRYRLCALSLVHDAPGTVRRRQLQRRHAIDKVPAEAELATVVYHPDTGYICGSPPVSGLAHNRSVTTGSTPLRLLVVSSAGVRNFGDDAMLLGTLERLQRVRPGCLPLVISDGSDVPSLGRLAVWGGTCRELGAAVSCPREAAEVLALFDLVLFSGGGNLATYWPELCRWRATIAGAARQAGVPYLVSGQGIGPVNEETAGLLPAFVSGAARFAVRDPHSFRLLRELGLAGPHVDVGLDDAVGLGRETGLRTQSRLRASGVPSGRPLLGFHARTAEYVDLAPAELRRWVRVVDEVAARAGWAVVCLPINDQPRGPEANLMTELVRAAGPLHASWSVVHAGPDVRALKGLVQACSVVLTCSYHVALFALEGGVPALLVSRSEYYQRKAIGLGEQVKLPILWDLKPTVSAGQLVERIEDLRRWDSSTRPRPDVGDAWLDRALALASRTGRTGCLTRAA